MPTLLQLIDHCDTRTRRTAFADHPNAFNGLQIANNGNITKIGSAVDAGLSTFQAAAAANIDFLIVHHGLYWNMPKPITGPLYDGISTLIKSNIALYSSHLPLDAHPELGNNALLARQLHLAPDTPFVPNGATENVGWIANNGTITREQLHAQLRQLYPRMIAIEYGSSSPKRIAFCSGSGNSAIPHLAGASTDTLVTGELREEWFTVAQEQKLNLYLCGHYATETHGVRALADELSKKFNIPHEFITSPNPL